MKEKIEQLLKKFTFLDKLKPEKELRVHPKSPRPDHDWRLVLVVFAFLVLIVGGYSYNLFFTVVHGNLADYRGGSVAIHTLKEQDLMRAVEMYEEKKDTYFELGGITLPSSPTTIVISDEVTLEE